MAKKHTPQPKSKPKPKTKGKPKLRLEWIEAGSLAENPENWRRHGNDQLAGLKQLIDDPEVGWAGAFLYNERTGRLIDGHGRKKVVDPKTPVPVLVGNWSEDAERKILLTLDPLASMATADSAQLDALLHEVSLGDDLQPLAELLAKAAVAAAPELAPQPPAEFTSFDENIETQHQCPKCGYEWSGKTKG
jgi:hypothetical protein